MDKIKLQLNVITKWVVVVFVLTTFVACSNKQFVEIKNKEGVVVESYFINKKHPEQKIGVYHKFYDDGKMLEESFFKDGKLNGKRTLFHPNGKIMQTENYIDNKYEGAFVAYYDNGNKQQAGFYKDNMMDSIWTNYYNSAKNNIKETVTMKENHVNGPYKGYSENGNLQATGNKKEIMDGIDVFDGDVLLYDSLQNNKIIRKLKFENGKQIAKEDL